MPARTAIYLCLLTILGACAPGELTMDDAGAGPVADGAIADRGSLPDAPEGDARLDDHNDGGGSADTITSIDLATAPDTGVIAPGAPGNLLGVGLSPNEIRISWSMAGAGDLPLAGYNVYRDGNPVAQLGVNATGYNDTPVVEGVSYVYHVTAYDSAGNESPSSNSVSVRPTSSTPGTLPQSWLWANWETGDAPNYPNVTFSTDPTAAPLTTPTMLFQVRDPITLRHLNAVSTVYPIQAGSFRPAGDTLAWEFNGAWKYYLLPIGTIASNHRVNPNPGPVPPNSPGLASFANQYDFPEPFFIPDGAPCGIVISGVRDRDDGAIRPMLGRANPTADESYLGLALDKNHTYFGIWTNEAQRLAGNAIALTDTNGVGFPADVFIFEMWRDANNTVTVYLNGMLVNTLTVPGAITFNGVGGWTGNASLDNTVTSITLYTKGTADVNRAAVYNYYATKLGL